MTDVLKDLYTDRLAVKARMRELIDDLAIYAPESHYLELVKLRQELDFIDTEIKTTREELLK
jgi:hypothetical protein